MQTRRNFELLIAKALILSSSVLWYPIGLGDGTKLHHLLILLLTVTSASSGSLPAYFGRMAKCAPVFFFGLSGWLLTLLVTTILFSTSWTPVKVCSFFLQLIIGNLAIHLILNNEGMVGLKKLANRSFILFFASFFLLSGLPLNDVVGILVRTIVTANPKIIIYEFLAKAPLFTSFSEEGLDGLRHTVSLYLVFIALVNLAGLRHKREVAIVLIAAFFLAMFQSRSAWLGILPPLGLLCVFQFLGNNRRPSQWIAALFLGATTITAASIALGPMVIKRASETGSYEGRFERLSEAWELLGTLSLSPVTMDRIFGSSHIYIIDSYYAGGTLGCLFSLMIVIGVVLAGRPRFNKKRQHIYLGLVFSFPLLVRLFTAGSGLPGIGATLCFAVAFHLSYAQNLSSSQ